ncbi:hypothetical protein KR222_010792 [Zaprionus bogoriensis]|nr:hypothetical protein KR222_010792 [Zaprionus bogoriensis]
MTATTATIINNLASGIATAAAATTAAATTTTEVAATASTSTSTSTRAAARRSPRSATNLTSRLLQATTGNMKTLLNRTLAGAAGAAGGGGGMPHATAVAATLPTLLLHGSLGPELANGQRIRHAGHTTPPTSVSSSVASEAAAAEGVAAAAGNVSSVEADLYNAFGALPAANLSGFIDSSTSSVLLASSTSGAPASSFPTQTMATFIAAGNKNRATTILVYPTVSPESIVIPIVSCIFGFPILALIVICCLRRRAKLARERDRRRNYDMQDHAVSLVRFSPIHRLNYRSSRAISLRPERSLSQGFTSLELDTVLEERCSDVEQTQTEILNPESPLDTNSYKMSFSSS